MPDKPVRGRPLGRITAPLWWPEHMRHLAWQLNDTIDKASAARQALAEASHRDKLWFVTDNTIPEPFRPSAEALVLQQVLRAYEEEATVLRLRLAKEFHVMTKMLNLDDKDTKP